MPQKKATGENSSEYNTPPNIFEQCSRIWGPFDLDVAATQDNHLCEVWYGHEDDGFTDSLVLDWHGRCWMNPPYSSKGLDLWCRKAWDEVHLGEKATLVCALLPAKPEQEWWYWVDKAQHIQFIQGRLSFAGWEHGAQFPSVLVVWHKKILR